jgi:hypothetical protein
VQQPQTQPRLRPVEAQLLAHAEQRDRLPDATRVVFDDERVVANAGVLLPAVLAGRLGCEALIDEIVDLGDRPGAANSGRKVMTLVSAMALGADCIDDCDVLRSGHELELALEHADGNQGALMTETPVRRGFIS